MYITHVIFPPDVIVNNCLQQALYRNRLNFGAFVKGQTLDATRSHVHVNFNVFNKRCMTKLSSNISLLCLTNNYLLLVNYKILDCFKVIIR